MYEYYKRYYYCSCGSIILTVSRKNHMKSKKHRLYKLNEKKYISLILEF